MGIFMKEGNPALGKTYRVVFLEEGQEKKITSELENADGLHFWFHNEDGLFLVRQENVVSMVPIEKEEIIEEEDRESSILPPLIPITGAEFRSSGALWFVNTILHLFGLAITWDPNTDELEAVRTIFRGFGGDINTWGYQRLSTYLRDNIDELLNEAYEED